MKFTVAALLALSATTTSAFQPLSVPRYTTTTTSALFQSTTTETAETEETRNNSKKDDRLRMMKSGQFHRRGFKEVREEVETRMEGEYQSSLVKDMRGNQYTMEKDGVKVYLAKVCRSRMMYSWWFRPAGFVWIMYLWRTQTWIIYAHISLLFVYQDFGFCWGVERSIALAYEAVDHFPDRKIHITNELIHNPEVNDKLHSMNVQFIEKMDGGAKNFDTVEEGDVVILPAFGASYEEMDYFDKKVSRSRGLASSSSNLASVCRFIIWRLHQLTRTMIMICSLSLYFRTWKLSILLARGCPKSGTLWTSTKRVDWHPSFTESTDTRKPLPPLLFARITFA